MCGILVLSSGTGQNVLSDTSWLKSCRREGPVSGTAQLGYKVHRLYRDTVVGDPASPSLADGRRVFHVASCEGHTVEVDGACAQRGRQTRSLAACM